MITMSVQPRNSVVRYSRRAAVLVWTAVSTTALVGFAALAVDLGYIRVVQVQLQNAADAAALAGASAFAHPAKYSKSFNPDTLTDLARDRTQAYGVQNQAEGRSLVLHDSDVTVGYLAHPENPADALTTAVQPYNAVRAVVRKTPDSSNGMAKVFFAALWGIRGAALAATATAVLDDRFGAYQPSEQGGALIPITVRKQKWIDEIVNKNGADVFIVNLTTGAVSAGSDDIPELSIYPEKQKGKGGGSDGAGNFGLLNFENGSSSVNPVADQIRHGLTSEEIQRTIGSEIFTFIDDNGQNVIHDIEGTPGLKASLKEDFEFRLGEVIGFFIHDPAPTGSGSNCVYRIVGIEYGRLLYVNLTGNGKSVVIQPCTYTGPENVTKPDAPRHGTGAKIKLVR